MGNSHSTEKAEQCKIHKFEFNELISVILDAHDITQFYASLSLIPLHSTNITSLKNFNPHSELFFMKKKNSNPEYLDIFYDLKKFGQEYEKLKDEQERRVKINDIFNKVHSILSSLVNELGSLCNKSE